MGKILSYSFGENIELFLFTFGNNLKPIKSRTTNNVKTHYFLANFSLILADFPFLPLK